MTGNGGGGSSAFKPLNTAADRRNDLIENLQRKKRGERETVQTQEDRYNKMVEKKMKEIQEKVSKSVRNQVILPGTSPSEGTREISKAAQDVVEQMAKMKAEKYAKKNKFKGMKIRPRIFTGMQGGRIDSKGRIFGPDGRYIAFVCKKTGKVKGRNGHTICYRYTDSSFCDYKISRFIQWQYDKKRLKSTLYAVNGFTTAGGGVYGSLKTGVHGGGNAGAGLWGAGGGWGDSGNNSGGSGWGGGSGGFWG